MTEFKWFMLFMGFIILIGIIAILADEYIKMKPITDVYLQNCHYTVEAFNYNTRKTETVGICPSQITVDSVK